MRHWTIVVGLLAGACFTEPTAEGVSTTTTTSGSEASTAAVESSTATTDDSSSSSTSSSSSSSSDSSSSSSSDCPEGERDCACFANGTCAQGFVCIADTCAPSLCGNGMPDPNEECDDGGLVPGDGCAADCTYEKQCFVGNFGGDEPIRLASFSVNRDGGILHRDTEEFAGTWTPSPNFSDETSISKNGRFVYLANEGVVEPIEIALDGTFGGTSSDLELPGLLGLAKRRGFPWVLAAANNGVFTLNSLVADPGGGNPSIVGTQEVQISSGSRAVLIDFHPQQDVAYVVVEPTMFTDNIELITVEVNHKGAFGAMQVNALPPIGYVRGMRAVQTPAELLFTGTFYAQDGNGCFGSLELTNTGQPSEAVFEARCEPPWGAFAGIIQPRPDALVTFGTAGMNIAEWDREDDPVSTLAIPGVRHFFRQPWPDMLLVASTAQLTTVSLNASGSASAILGQLDLQQEGLAPDTGNPWFQAGVMLPCPDAP